MNARSPVSLNRDAASSTTNCSWTTTWTPPPKNGSYDWPNTASNVSVAANDWIDPNTNGRIERAGGSCAAADVAGRKQPRTQSTLKQRDLCDLRGLCGCLPTMSIAI